MQSVSCKWGRSLLIATKDAVPCPSSIDQVQWASASAMELLSIYVHAVLGRWLQLYMLGDPESAEAELADELAGIYSDALPSAKGLSQDS